MLVNYDLLIAIYRYSQRILDHTAGGKHQDSAITIVAIVAPLIAIIVIALVFVWWKKQGMNEKNITQSSLETTLSVEPQSEVESIKSQTLDSKFIRCLLNGNADMIDYEKEIIPQIAHIPHNKKREIPRSAFQIKSHLGSGNFGSVHKGEVVDPRGNKSKIPVAIKSIQGLSGQQEIQNFLYEIKIMGYIKPHFNLVNMVGSCSSDLENKGDLWLIIEFCDLGELKTFVVEKKNEILSGAENTSINSRNLVLWSYHISKGMEYLASNFIMHGDLAARNVLLRKNSNKNGCPVAVIADFGLSKNLYYDTTYSKENRLEIPWKWTSLEYLDKDYFTLKSDVWSFMVLVWEMFSFGRSPYGRCSYDEVLEKLLNGYRLPCPEGFGKVTTWSPQDVYNKLSEKCFVAEPKDRASFSDIVEILEGELRKEELEKYVQDNQNYEENNIELFSRLSIIN